MRVFAHIEVDGTFCWVDIPDGAAMVEVVVVGHASECSQLTPPGVCDCSPSTHVLNLKPSVS